MYLDVLTDAPTGELDTFNEPDLVDCKILQTAMMLE